MSAILQLLDTVQNKNEQDEWKLLGKELLQMVITCVSGPCGMALSQVQRNFHVCRLSPVIRARWNSCIGMLHIILSQGVSRVSGVTFQLILKRLMHTVVKQMVVPSNLTLTAPLSLTNTEENVVRYVAGYVVMKLKKNIVSTMIINMPVYRIAGYFRGVYISRIANSILVREK